MDEKTEGKLKREEIATYLETLAKGFRDGKFTLAANSWKIPNSVDVKINHKEKRGQIETKIKWRWLTLSEYKKEAKEEVNQWRKSLTKIKKQMEVSFKSIEKAVKNNQLPANESIMDHIKSSKAFAEFSEPEWQEAMKEYNDHLENLKSSVASGQLEVVQHEVRDLRARMKNCHKDFK